MEMGHMLRMHFKSIDISRSVSPTATLQSASLLRILDNALSNMTITFVVAVMPKIVSEFRKLTIIF
jgi:hypothetical protein